MLLIDLVYQYTGVIAIDVIGEAYAHAINSHRSIRKFILRKKLYDHFKDYVRSELKKNGLVYKGEKLDVNGIPVEYSLAQTKPLVIEYKGSRLRKKITGVMQNKLKTPGRASSKK